METANVLTINGNDKKELESLNAFVKSAIKDGFNPNAFACKLSAGTHKGKTTGVKSARKWENANGKGLILTIEAVFNGVKERVNVSDIETFELYGVNSDITVEVKANSKGQLTAYPVKDSVNVGKPAKATAKAK